MIRKPADWPRYMVDRRLRDGSTAYYWTPRPKDIAAGFPLSGEALGPHYGQACERAGTLNAHLDAWRGAAAKPADIDQSHRFGTLGWLVERYRRSAAWDKVSPRHRPHYEYILGLVTEHRLANGDRLGDAPVAAISALAVDKLYAKLRTGPRGPRTRVAELCMVRTARAWDVVRRLYPKVVPAENPWRGVEMVHGKGTTRPATRAEAYALADALAAHGQPWLGAVALVCFEWHQRPENVLAGSLRWSDYRPAERPHHVRIAHHKTGAEVWLPLEDADGPLFPEICAWLDRLERAAPQVAVARRQDGGTAIADRHRAGELVRAARTTAGLPSHVTFAACRHGGLTELGDAELTEQGVMSLSGHRTPDAARLYVKRTETQRGIAARRRRAYVEAGGTESTTAPDVRGQARV